MTDREQAAYGPDPDVLRAEAERLVAAGLAAVSVAADRIGAPTRERGGAAAAGFDALGDMLFGPATHRRHSVANDSPECCHCPVCRVIAAARQPSPAFADRLATGVGFMAGSAARVLRGVAGAMSAPEASRGAAAEATDLAAAAGTVRQPAGGGPGGGHADPWAMATAEPAAPTRSAPAMATAPTPVSTVAAPAPPGTVARKVVKKAVKRADGSGSAAGPTDR